MSNYIMVDKSNAADVLEAVGMNTDLAISMISAYREPCPAYKQSLCRTGCPFKPILEPIAATKTGDSVCPLYRIGRILRGIDCSALMFNADKVIMKVGEL